MVNLENFSKFYFSTKIFKILVHRLAFENFKKFSNMHFICNFFEVYFASTLAFLKVLKTFLKIFKFSDIRSEVFSALV